MVQTLPARQQSTLSRFVARTFAVLLLASAASAQPIVALTAPAPLLGTQQLHSFNSAAPGVISPGLTITGLASGEILLAIDFRPATGELFGLGSSGRLYLIDTATAAVHPRGDAPFAVTLRGSYFGFDFNPVTDLARVTSSAGQNFRVNPVNGTVVDADPTTPGTQPDANLRFAAGDQSEAATPRVVASAFTNSYYGADSTTLFNIDSALNNLIDQEPPNDGILHTITPIGVTFARDVIGFDIAAREDTAFITGPGSLPMHTGFYALHLKTGAARFLGNIGALPLTIKSIAAQPPSCPCDFNFDRTLTSQDLFDFLPPFFARHPRCDINRDGDINSQDFFDFLACIFSPPETCSPI